MDLPQNAVIREAGLRAVYARWDNGTDLSIRAEASAEPSAPVDYADYTGRTRTGAVCAWTSDNSDLAYRDSPDLAALIQELVNSNGYSGGTILIFVEYEGSSMGADFVSPPYEDGLAPQLYVRYG